MDIESWVTSEDATFVTADGPRVITVYSGVLHPYPVCEGYIACDGPDTLEVSISQDGTNYGGTLNIKAGEVVTLGGTRVGLIKLYNAGAADAAYRLVVAPTRYHDY